LQDDESDTYETQLLENTIIKIGGLLQVGFGEAGRDIIGKNMAGQGVLKPITRGQQVRVTMLLRLIFQLERIL
jgi:hypothetical protein